MTLEEKFSGKEKVTISLQMEKDQLRKVDEIAEYVGRNRSEIIRVFINDGLTDSYGIVEKDKK